MKKAKIETGYRTLNIRSGDIDSDNRTVDLSFSSELPVSRWFGQEILDHNPSSVNLERLNNSAAVLVDHRGDQVGVVEKASIKDKRGIATLRFSQNGKGADVFQDIQDGIRKNISFGYQVNELTLEKEIEGQDSVYRSNSWTPFEISVVGVPADHTVGVGRSQEEGTEIEVDDSFRELEEKPVEELIEEANEENKPCNIREKILLLKGKTLSKQIKSLGKEA